MGSVEQDQPSVSASMGARHDSHSHATNFPIKIQYRDTAEVVIACSPDDIEPGRTFYLLKLRCNESREHIMTEGLSRPVNSSQASVNSG